MCGIAAVFAYRHTAPSVDEVELHAITESMRRRGPDAGGVWLDAHGRAGLGSRRLAIIDPTPEGNQPMFDVEHELVIAFNGEIYNHKELRASLERTGHSFHSKTDTEVLLRLYRRDGPQMLGLLRGMYAFVLWDSRSRQMFVARDPYGIKPLYISDDGGTVRIASEVNALIAGGRVSETLDSAGVAGFFLFGSVPEPFTIRREIHAVGAGEAFLIDEARGRGEIITHASIADAFRRAEQQQATARLTEAEIAIRERVEDSVRCHLVADVPISVFLSAGIDSSVIALYARRHSSAPLHTFTLTFEEFQGQQDDEAPLASRFARDLGIVHTTRLVTRAEFLADLPAFFRAMDQPTIDGVNTWFISKAVSEAGGKVALSGLGGDELFGSYPSFRRVPQFVRLNRTPAGRLIPWLTSHPKAAMLESTAKTFGGAYLIQRGLFAPGELPALIGEETAREGLARLSPIALLDRKLQPDPRNDYGRVATLEATQYMRNQLLRDADWAGMAHSIEIRTPLVDLPLLRQIAPVVVEHGVHAKQKFGSGLPPWLRERKKTGFFVPMRDWLDLAPDGTTTRMRSWAVRVFETFRSTSISRPSSPGSDVARVH